ncbi:MAG: cytochrome d ubiquinol oxidase subunit II [Alphaproteobacteria bacterium]|nr:cytochrome d ubiquinol oxidase subunit II [Alphaproteobacteria bacterium]
MMLDNLLDYGTLRFIWWIVPGIVFIGFAVLDGFDMGTAVLLPFIGRDDEDRRVMINTIGPVWESNQVWFILGGGALFAAWPYLYAVAFSGFYLAMFILLCAFILRPVSIKFRSKMPQRSWRYSWDCCLFISGVVPPVIFGVALGNAMLGVPFTLDNTMRMTYEGGLWDMLNPFSLLCGAVGLAMVVFQGSVWINLKTEGNIEKRARKVAMFAGAFTLALFCLAGVWVSSEGYRIASAIVMDGPSNPLLKTVVKEAGAWFGNYKIFPAGVFVPALAFVGVGLSLLAVYRRTPLLGFIASSLVCASIVGTAGVSMFPFLLPSSIDPNVSLTVWDASSSRTTLLIMTFVTVVFMPIVIAYVSWVYRIMRGKVTAAYIKEKSDSVY